MTRSVEFIEFVKYIESIGFKLSNYTHAIIYGYKQYTIQIFPDKYYFNNGSEWIYSRDLNDLTPLKQIIRSYKLKKILK